MDEVSAAVKAILGIQGATTDIIIAALKKEAKDVHQTIFDDGHGVAMAQQQAKIDRLTNEKAELIRERDRLGGELRTARQGSPDAAALQEKIDELTETIDTLKSSHQNELRQRDVDGALEKLRAKVAPVVVEGYDEVLVDRPSTKRLFIHDEEGKLKVLRPGKTTPYAGDYEAQIQSLADDLLKDVKPALKRAAVPPGSGQPGEGPASPGGKAEVFDKAREDAKKQTGHQIANPEAELDRRLGLGVRSA